MAAVKGLDMFQQEFLIALQNRLGVDVVLTGDAIEARYHTDWSGTPPVQPLALVRPAPPKKSAQRCACVMSIALPLCLRAA